jgi:hypothetical protein
MLITGGAAATAWPQTPQKRALSETGLLHFGQFMEFSEVTHQAKASLDQRSEPKYHADPAK